RLPKNGAPPTLVNEAGATVAAATALGGTVYWVEHHPLAVVMSAPLMGNSVTNIFLTTDAYIHGWFEIAVTSSTVFGGASDFALSDFPVSGASAATLLAPLINCSSITSDSDAVYCAQPTGSNVRIASDGTTTPLGPAVNSSFIVFDDTNVYWVD